MARDESSIFRHRALAGYIYFPKLRGGFMRPTIAYSSLIFILVALVPICLRAEAQVPGDPVSTASSAANSPAGVEQAPLVTVPRLEGVAFVNGSGSQIVLERDGKRYLIDTQ